MDLFPKMVMVFLSFSIISFTASVTWGAPYKVLAVMSYDEAYPWSRELTEGINSVLKETCEITWFYMDTKRRLETGKARGEEAFALYRSLKPDGVIAADDNAQSLFVVPYLSGKVKTPVAFCGVNAEAEKYGYPSSNVTGILERHHARESLAFVQQLVPTVKSVGYMVKDSPSGRALFDQIRKELDTYPVISSEFRLPKTFHEALDFTGELRSKCDALFVETMHGIIGEDGKPLTDMQVLPQILKIFGKPTLGSNVYHVRGGVLCAVVKTGQEQGRTAAEMLLKAMSGTPVSQIPITRNVKGRILINVDTMKALGITPASIALHGAELLRNRDYRFPEK